MQFAHLGSQGSSRPSPKAARRSVGRGIETAVSDRYFEETSQGQ
jgi:hypothetical protein